MKVGDQDLGGGNRVLLHRNDLSYSVKWVALGGSVAAHDLDILKFCYAFLFLQAVTKESVKERLVAACFLRQLDSNRESSTI